MEMLLEQVSYYKALLSELLKKVKEKELPIQQCSDVTRLLGHVISCCISYWEPR